MCVLIIKHAHNQLPSYSTLRACYNANPHGCGFSTPSRIYKTLDFEKFINELYKVDEAEPCILHFRLATHGSIKRSNCHPFLDTRTGVTFAHNGILNIIPRGDKTDSETAFRDLFMPIIKNEGIYSPDLKAEVYKVIGSSKFAFMDADGNLKTFGQFTMYGDGCYYSNTRWIYHLNKNLWYAS